MPVELSEGWVGRRVTIRRVVARAADGRPLFGDVVGDLVDLGAAAALVEERDGLTEVPLASVALARLVPPSTAQELALEAVAALGWRPEHTARLGGWLLRADGSSSRRANSVLPLKPPGVPLPEALERAAAWYAERGRPLRFAVPAESRRLLDAELGERGWMPSSDILVMTARLDRLATGDDTGVRRHAVPSQPWLRRYADGAAASDTARAVLARHERVVFAGRYEAEDALAVARGVVDEDWLGVSAVAVAAERRRAGLGRAVMQVVWGWGRSQGATRSYVQVDSADPGAVAFCAALGYNEHHAYRYRDAPAGSA